MTMQDAGMLMVIGMFGFAAALTLWHVASEAVKAIRGADQ